MYRMQVFCICKPHRPSKRKEAGAETLVARKQRSSLITFLCKKLRRELRTMIAVCLIFSMQFDKRNSEFAREQQTVASGSTCDQSPSKTVALVVVSDYKGKRLLAALIWLQNALTHQRPIKQVHVEKRTRLTRQAFFPLNRGGESVARATSASVDQGALIHASYVYSESPWRDFGGGMIKSG